MKEGSEQVQKILANKQVAVRIDPDLLSAGDSSIYVYVSPDKNFLLYSSSLEKLLSDPDIPRPLAVSRRSISFLLQSGATPPPETIYKDVFIINSGAVMHVDCDGGGLNVEFSWNFPYYRSLSTGETSYKHSQLLERLYNATAAGVTKGHPTVLFHSAGKDSNAIALALAEAGCQSEVKLICYKAPGKQDESEISKAVSKRLGFKHLTLDLERANNAVSERSIKEYFECMPLPGTDNATLAYSLYSGIYDFSNSNFIDGMGNDVYIGHIPGKLEHRLQRFSPQYDMLTNFVDKCPSESLMHMLYGSRIERVGLMGLSYADVKRLSPSFCRVKDYWNEESDRHKELNYLDLTAKFSGGIIDTEIFMRKVENFAQYNKSKVVFPWNDRSVANYVFNMPEERLFDRTLLRNKLFLRELLKERLDLDSDALGKLGYGFNYWSVMIKLENIVEEEIVSCWAWDPREASSILARLKAVAKSNKYNANRAKSLIHRLFLVAAWLNNSSYIRTDNI